MSSGAAPAQTRAPPAAQSEHQVTGVTVSERGRIFVDFPRWTENSPVSAGGTGALVEPPFDSGRLHGPRNGNTLKRFNARED